MLRIEVPLVPEGWDEEKEEFIPPKVQVLQLEHSLVSLSKWESKWCKPFLSAKEKTDEETLDYIKCMTLTQNVKPEVYEHLTRANVDAIYEYINAPMTATRFSERSNNHKNGRVVTAELIYHWMIIWNIPFECQKWHINKLLTLIRVCSEENAPKKKMSQSEIAKQNAKLNEARRKQMNTRG